MRSRDSLSINLVKFLRDHGFTVNISTIGSDTGTAIFVRANGNIGEKESTVEWKVTFNGDISGKMIVDGTTVATESLMYHLSWQIHNYYKKYDKTPVSRTWNRIVEILTTHGFVESGTDIDAMNVMPPGRDERERWPHDYVPKISDIRNASKRFAAFTGFIGTDDRRVVVVIAERDPTSQIDRGWVDGTAFDVSKKFRNFYGLLYLDGTILIEEDSVARMMEQTDRLLGLTVPEIIAEEKKKEFARVSNEIGYMERCYNRRELARQERYQALSDKRAVLQSELKSIEGS